jgi:uncharacterized membrane protein
MQEVGSYLFFNETRTFTPCLFFLAGNCPITLCKGSDARSYKNLLVIVIQYNRLLVIAGPRDADSL